MCKSDYPYTYRHLSKLQSAQGVLLEYAWPTINHHEQFRLLGSSLWHGGSPSGIARFCLLYQLGRFSMSPRPSVQDDRRPALRQPMSAAHASHNLHADVCENSAGIVPTRAQILGVIAKGCARMGARPPCHCNVPRPLLDLASLLSISRVACIDQSHVEGNVTEGNKLAARVAASLAAAAPFQRKRLPLASTWAEIHAQHWEHLHCPGWRLRGNC